jgi:hypothetical protein
MSSASWTRTKALSSWSSKVELGVPREEGQNLLFGPIAGGISGMDQHITRRHPNPGVLRVGV